MTAGLRLMPIMVLLLAAALTLGSEQALAACTPDVYPNTDTPYITVYDGDEDILIPLKVTIDLAT